MRTTRCNKGRAARPSPKRGLEDRIQRARKSIRKHMAKLSFVHEKFKKDASVLISKEGTRRELLYLDIQGDGPLVLTKYAGFEYRCSCCNSQVIREGMVIPSGGFHVTSCRRVA